MRWVGFVRNVMIGREGLHRDDLLRIVRDAGAVDVRSHTTTGNVTFTAEADQTPYIVARVEAGVERVIGRQEIAALRELTWLQDLIGANPFATFDTSEWELEVALLAHDAPPLRRVQIEDPGRTVIVKVQERELLAARPRRGGHRPHVNRLLERASGLSATSRGWSTLHRIASRADL